ncbi:MAG: YnbE family lipoprotein [Proteobacteria bacterium]|nr:YnbE family lipoprotein [Pseudomonadota bacterium]MBU1585886.1 YnbE family lipoprotein [Pseudomonadota bacterium]MBU2452940.1 YnbE family lipoprotein [Pseudomonadota bacterium]MBU2627957.1 YnbE family lipoprotein [Pseudomonadota bacterium]
MTRRLFFIAVFFGFFIFSGCQTSHEIEVKPIESSHQVEVKPIRVEPIHITIDINVRVEKALDDFFDDIEAAENKIKK